MESPYEVKLKSNVSCSSCDDHNDNDLELCRVEMSYSRSKLVASLLAASSPLTLKNDFADVNRPWDEVMCVMKARILYTSSGTFASKFVSGEEPEGGGRSERLLNDCLQDFRAEEERRRAFKESVRSLFCVNKFALGASSNSEWACSN